MKTLHTKDAIWVQKEGRIYRLSTAKKSRSRTGESESTDLIAPFSCKVLKVAVKPGQSLKKGDPVVVVEAMKMEYTYHSPKDGTVESVHVEVGQILQAGQHFIQWGKT